LENLSSFKGFLAGYTSNTGSKYSNEFEALPADWYNKGDPKNFDPNDINFEDVVSIRRLDNTDHSSAIVADVNKS
jgi:hypothetical protein